MTSNFKNGHHALVLRVSVHFPHTHLRLGEGSGLHSISPKPQDMKPCPETLSKMLQSFIQLTTVVRNLFFSFYFCSLWVTLKYFNGQI